jgi:hypothetical protein
MRGGMVNGEMVNAGLDRGFVSVSRRFVLRAPGAPLPVATKLLRSRYSYLYIANV